MSGTEQAVGRVVGTERHPNTPHEFHFWARAHSPVGIGTLVKVAAPGAPTVYGIVVEGSAYSDAESALSDYLAAGGDAAAESRDPASPGSPASAPASASFYKAAVLRHDPPEPLQPVRRAPVYLLADEDVAFALRMEGYARAGGTGLPVGLYAAGGQQSPVFLDADFLLGPEAAHLNITGVSGLATKTSAVLFLLKSIFAHTAAEKGSVAALCFNVKGPDLLFLDQPAELGEEDRAMYRRLGVPASPFEQVRYYAPYKPDGFNLSTLRTNPALAENVEPLVWGLEQILKFAEVLLTREDVDAKADALIEYIRERVVGRVAEDLPTRLEVRTFQELAAWFEEVLQLCEKHDTQSWKTHHVATIRKVRNRLLNLSTRAKGLVSNDASASDLPWGAFQDRTVYVVDVANVEPEAQELIFARVITEARERLERGELGVEHLVVFVDELNKYAPADGLDTYVRKMLLDVSERGRYLGLVLFSAQQFRSQVHKRVVGNAGTALYGRMDMDELATPGYLVLSPATKSRLATLAKGELMVRHPHFAQPVFLRFPRPPCMAGREGVRRFEPARDLPFQDAVARHLRALDPELSANAIKDAIAGREPGDILAALHQVQQLRPQAPLSYLLSILKKKAPREVVPPEGPARPRLVMDLPEDPYA